MAVLADDKRPLANNYSQIQKCPALFRGASCNQKFLVRSLFFHVLGAFDGLVDFEQVADVVHKGEHAHRKEPDGVERKERSNNPLARVDVFEQTENAVNADDEFEKRHPRELLRVVAYFGF